MGKKAKAFYECIRGETVKFGIRDVDGGYVGTETVTCGMKAARSAFEVPQESDPLVLSLVPQYVALSGDEPAHWLFTITPAQSDMLPAGRYVLDAKITDASGNVDYLQPIGLEFSEKVTP